MYPSIMSMHISRYYKKHHCEGYPSLLIYILRNDRRWDLYLFRIFLSIDNIHRIHPSFTSSSSSFCSYAYDTWWFLCDYLIINIIPTWIFLLINLFIMYSSLLKFPFRLWAIFIIFLNTIIQYTHSLFFFLFFLCALHYFSLF